MRRHSLAAGLFAAALLLGGALPQSAHALSCLAQTPELIFQFAAVIFEGRVAAVTPRDNGDIVTFEVRRVFKGEASNRTVIRSVPFLGGPKYENGQIAFFAGNRGPQQSDTPLVTAACQFNLVHQPEFRAFIETKPSRTVQ